MIDDDLLQVFRVDAAVKHGERLTVIIDRNGVDDPNDKRELLVLARRLNRRAFYFDREWLAVPVGGDNGLKLWLYPDDG